MNKLYKLYLTLLIPFITLTNIITILLIIPIDGLSIHLSQHF